MNEENELYQEEIREDDLGPILPDGYADGDDFFDPNTWSGEQATDSASEEPAADTGAEGTPEATQADAPATEPEAEPASSSEDGTPDDVPATDATENAAPSSKRRVKYQFDHQDIEEDIDLDADLPELLQKARSVDRYKDRLTGAQSLRDRVEKTAKALKYETAEAFLDAILENAKASDMQALKDRGTPDEIAEDYVSRKYADASAVVFPKADEAPPVGNPEPAARDFATEARELLIARPELRGKELPAEVYTAAMEPGKTLLTAYAEYERKVAQAEAETARKDAEKLRKENRILKNNAASADRAPVSGVSRGGKAEDNGQKDPFLEGFNSVF